MAKKKAAKKKTLPKKIPKPVKVTSAPRKKQNPEFEQILAEEAQAAESRKAIEEQKAGPTDTQVPSAEAPPEFTVPPKAAKALAPVLKIPFAIWSNIEKIPEIRLSQDEALEWAEPIVDILEYYFPGKIPEIAWMWLMLLESTGRVIDSRIEIRHQKKKQLSSASEGPQKTAGQGPDSNQRPAPSHNGAEPATEYPKDG